VDSWLIVTIIVVLAVLLALAAGWVRRVTLRSGDQEVSAEAPTGGKLQTRRSIFRRSRVKGRGASLNFRDTEADDSNFDIK